jgi:protein PhnA
MENPDLMERSGGSCELCGAAKADRARDVAGKADEQVLLCGTCSGQLDDPGTMDKHHWRCLSDSMWSEHAAIQVMAWRVLNHLSGEESWAQDLLDQLYLEEDVQTWAEAESITTDETETAAQHLDSNGALLADGDTVTLIKDLDVKGANFTAKRGTSVRGISLVPDTPEHIEGRVNGTRIVLLTKFIKKTT